MEVFARQANYFGAVSGSGVNACYVEFKGAAVAGEFGQADIYMYIYIYIYNRRLMRGKLNATGTAVFSQCFPRASFV